VPTLRTAAVLACLLLLTGCGGQEDATRPDAAPTSQESGDQMRTMTEQQAAERAQEHIDRAVAALPEQPTLTLQDESSTECLDPTDNGPRGRYEVGKTYWLDDLPATRNAEYVTALYDYWTTNGFQVLTDERSADNMFVSVENNDDSFRMSVKQSIEGDLSLGASSPCVWPDGVPPDGVQG
jgi:hypothetical protein